MKKKDFILILVVSLFWWGVYLLRDILFQEEYVPFRPLKVDTRGFTPVYVYSQEKIVDRDLKGRYALGLLYYEVPVKLDRYRQLSIPKVVYNNKVFMMNFSSRMMDERILENTIYPHPDSVYRTK
jgi:hypothetical protein